MLSATRTASGSFDAPLKKRSASRPCSADRVVRPQGHPKAHPGFLVLRRHVTNANFRGATRPHDQRAPRPRPRAYPAQPRAEYQSSTRKARSVFHRLGRPSPSSDLDRHRAGVAGLERPAAVAVALRCDQVDRLGHALVGRDAGAAQVFEPPQHVVVPPRREGEARPGGAALAVALDPLAGRPPAEEARARAGTPARAGGPPSPPALPPPARSYSSRASSTQIVVLNDDRVEPLSASQFQPPSGSCSASSRSTMPRTSWPK